MLDDELLDHLQRGAFGYFVNETNPANGLVADTSRKGLPRKHRSVLTDPRALS